MNFMPYLASPHVQFLWVLGSRFLVQIFVHRVIKTKNIDHDAENRTNKHGPTGLVKSNLLVCAHQK